MATSRALSIIAKKERSFVFFKLYNVDVYVNVNCSSSETIHNRSKA